MRVTLIYNGKSGSAASEEEILSELDAIGWTVDRWLEMRTRDPQAVAAAAQKSAAIHVSVSHV